MVREIIRDTFFLSLPSREATAEDRITAADLRDTLLHNRERCVGLAANMIGVNVRIIAFFDKGRDEVMINPVLLSFSGEYRTREGCLSLDGQRETKRFRKIKVKWTSMEGKLKMGTFTDYTAQIIQHEMDHLSGILI